MNPSAPELVRSLGFMLLAAWLMLARSACGQAAPAPTDLTAEVRIGWGDFIERGELCPVRARITGGSRPESGVLVAECGYGRMLLASQRVTTPFATTPGRTIEVDALIDFPAGDRPWDDGSPWVRVTINTGAGKRIERVFRPGQPGADGAFMPPPMPRGTPVTLVVGELSLAKLGGVLSPSDPTQPDSPDASGGVWWTAPILQLAPSDLSSQWRAYERTSMVVLDGRVAAAVPERARAAIRQWVESGGLLVIVTSDPTFNQAQWLGFQAVSFERNEGAAPAGGPAAIDVRMVPTPAAAHGGWHARGLSAGFAMENTGGFACGPVGLGLAAVFTLDPGLVSSSMSTGEVWNADLKELIEPRYERMATSASDREYWYAAHEPPYVERESRGFDSLLEMIDATPFPVVIVVVFAVVLLLVVGLVDRMIVRRFRIGRWSWATALGWIVLFAVVAQVVPSMARSGAAIASSMRVIDAVQGGAAIESSLTAAFAGAGGGLKIEESNARAWWSHVLVPHERGRSLAEMLQAEGNTPRSVRQPVWTLSRFRAQGPVEHGFSARAVRFPEGVIKIEVTPPNGAQVVKISAIAEGCRSERSAGPLNARLVLAPDAALLQLDEEEVVELVEDFSGASGKGWDGVPGWSARGDSIARRIARGDWALVMIEAEEVPATFRVSNAQHHRMTTMVRLVVPVETESAASEAGR